MDDFATDKMREEAEREGWTKKPIERPKPIQRPEPIQGDLELRKQRVVDGCITRNQISKLQKAARIIFGTPDHIAHLNEFLKQHFGIECAERVPQDRLDLIIPAMFKTKQNTRRSAAKGSRF